MCATVDVNKDHVKYIMFMFMIMLKVVVLFTFRSNPNLVPKRTFRTAYGAWLMLSEPPHSTTSDSFSWISYTQTHTRTHTHN